ncbi:sulfurtransferase [Streptomyces sp. NPDC005263]|uniref:sulfurtransferase n=1 Tax=Streptomyces sp. NPDC005263 TaxID=3364711 RepID=UPI0036A0BAE5
MTREPRTDRTGQFCTRQSGGARTDDTPPEPRQRSIDDLLARARTHLDRFTPRQAARELADGALLVDVRTDLVCRAEGETPGSLVMDRNVVEWRLDPCSTWHIEEADDHSLRSIAMCSQG